MTKIKRKILTLILTALAGIIALIISNLASGCTLQARWPQNLKVEMNSPESLPAESPAKE